MRIGSMIHLREVLTILIATIWLIILVLRVVKDLYKTRQGERNKHFHTFLFMRSFLIPGKNLHKLKLAATKGVTLKRLEGFMGSSAGLKVDRIPWLSFVNVVAISGTESKFLFSDHPRFAEDKRVYKQAHINYYVKIGKTFISGDILFASTAKGGLSGLSPFQIFYIRKLWRFLELLDVIKHGKL